MNAAWVGRCERWLWYLFLAALPLQTRLILWSGRSPFSEWFSVALWGTDVMLLLLVLLATVRDRRWLARRADSADLAGVLLVLVAALSVARALVPLVALVGTLRLTFGVLLFWYVRAVAFRRFDADRSVLAFIIGALAQAVMGLSQYVLQRDLGLRILGETLLARAMRGVAVFYDATGEKILRAYGTLPHPNVLAMVLLLALMGLLWLFVRHDTHARGHRIVWATGAALFVWGIGVTYARTIAGAGLLAAAVLMALIFSRVSHGWANITLVRRRLWSAVLVCALACALFVAVQWPEVSSRASVSSKEEAVTLRITFNREAIRSGSGWALHVNWTGIGIANFVPWLERWDPGMPRDLVQPAHNLFLLVYTELGILGVAALAAWLVAVLAAAWRAWSAQPVLRAGLLCIAAILLASAALDHFFWTLQQGRLLWWLAWALIAGPATLEHDA